MRAEVPAQEMQAGLVHAREQSPSHHPPTAECAAVARREGLRGPAWVEGQQTPLLDQLRHPDLAAGQVVRRKNFLNAADVNQRPAAGAAVRAVNAVLLPDQVSLRLEMAPNAN